MKAILYLPVSKQYIKKWEYYQVDFDMLSSVYDEVVVCTSVTQVLKNIVGADLLYCWWWQRSLPAILISKLFGVDSAITGAIHMFDSSGGTDYYNKSHLYRWFTKGSLGLADYNFFISHDQKIQVTSHLKVNNPIALRSSLTKKNDIKASDIQEIILKREALKDGGKIRFATVAWHTKDTHKRKGVYQALEALHRLDSIVDFNWEWNIVGATGDGVDSLREKIKELGLSKKIFLLLDLSQEEKNEIYLATDLLIQPSWYEGFGNAVLEAMSFGVPALVSRYAAQPEVVDDSGLIVMEIDVDHIYRALYGFVNATKNDRLEMSRKALTKVINDFSFQKRLEDFKRSTGYTK